MSALADRRIVGQPAHRLMHAFGGLSWRLAGLFALVLLLMNVGTAISRIAAGLNATEALVGIAQGALIDAVAILPSALAVVAAANLTTRPSRRVAALTVAVIGGSLAGHVILSSLTEVFWPGASQPDSDTTVSELKVFAWRYAGWLTSVALVATAATLYVFVLRDREAAERLHREELARVGLDRQMTEARLQVMQAQIEPHFLFNTLANVRRLYQTDPPLGRSMLRHLTAYLSAALPEMRVSQSTLGQELALTIAYLNVQKIRMGSRLTFDVDVPTALRSAMVPSMMLLTLVENAIKHGLAPLAEGGVVRIVARDERGTLSLQVFDTGRGILEGSGPGIGLANLRLRLSTLFGGRGIVAIEPNVPSGCLATIELPIAWSSAAGNLR